MNKQKGFSLIELLVVIAILGALAAIAIPTYSSYRTKAFRTSAKVGLVESAQNMERYFTRNNTYVGAAVGDPAAGDQVLQWTEGRKYQLSIQVSTATTFTLRATPQFIENTCGYLEITHTGAKISEFAGSCW